MFWKRENPGKREIRTVSYSSIIVFHSADSWWNLQCWCILLTSMYQQITSLHFSGTLSAFSVHSTFQIMYTTYSSQEQYISHVQYTYIAFPTQYIPNIHFTFLIQCTLHIFNTMYNYSGFYGCPGHDGVFWGLWMSTLYRHQVSFR